MNERKWPKRGILIVGIYFKQNVPNAPNDARRWLKDTLINQLKARLSYENDDFITPIEYALTRYIPYIKNEKERKQKNSKHARPAGRAKGGEYKYIVQNVNDDFYYTLLDILEESKNKVKWFGDYYVLIAKRVRKL